MTKTRISVIGASLAGLEFANALMSASSAARFDVNVFEEHERVGYPIRCAEGLVLFHDLEPPDETVIVNEAEIVLVRFLDEDFHILDSVAIPCAGSAWLIDRPRAEQRLADLCEGKGVSIFLNRKVQLQEVLRDSELVVDASGCPSQYSRHLGQTSPAPSVGIGGVVSADLGISPRCFVIDFHPRVPGYFWIFPRNKKQANIGVGWHRSGPAVDNGFGLLRTYLDSMFGTWNIERRVSGSLGTRVMPKVYDPDLRVALIGDAAGFANPLVGEGMSGAIFSARALAKCVADGKLERYSRIVRQQIAIPHGSGIVAREVYEKLGYEAFRRVFMAIDQPTLDLLHMPTSRLAVKLLRHPRVISELLLKYMIYKFRLVSRAFHASE